MNRYYVEFEGVDAMWTNDAVYIGRFTSTTRGIYMEDTKNVCLYVNAKSADQVRNMFAEYNIVAVDQTD